VLNIWLESGFVRKDTFRYQSFAQADVFGVIDVQYDNRCAAGWRAAHQDAGVPLKVLRPDILPWMKEACQLSGLRIKSRDVRPLVLVAVQAGQRQIRGGRWSAVLLGDDMIDLERKGIEELEHPAVFAGVVRPAPDEVFQGWVHGNQAASKSRRDLRALDFKRARRWPT
jgi:hypothetical protein